MRQYIKGKRDWEYVFPSRKGENSHITVAHVSRILAETGRQFGLKNISAHSMRKTFAYQIYVESEYNITLGFIPNTCPSRPMAL